MNSHMTAENVLRFRVELTGIEPPIWREFEVPSSYSFWDLHVAIQDAMGWQDCHLHAFRTKEPVTGEIIEIGIPSEDDFGDGSPILPGWQVHVVAYLNEPGRTVNYEYDFGDGWQHRVQLLDIVPGKPGTLYPKCLAGERACPPEDCGGIWGYQSLVEAIRDPSHEDHDNMLRWLGGPFDPDRFIAADVKFDDPQHRWRHAFGKHELD